MPQLPLMAHLVLGYPTLAKSLETAEQYIQAGVQILELQIPFSHPTADGPVITAACQEAIRQGVSVQDCLEAIRHIRTVHPAQEIMVMSYLNRVYTYGFQRFLDEMNALEIRHVIIPDLPVDTGNQVSGGILSGQSPVKLVPVLAANVTEARLHELLSTGFDFYYLMSDFKITGSGYSLHPRLEELIRTIKTADPSHRVGIGFGVSTPEQAQKVCEVADLAIIGSSLIIANDEGRLAPYLEALKAAFQPSSLV
jgi:tryptophan synthase alpha chain